MTDWARATLCEIGSPWYKWINPGEGDACPEIPGKCLRFWTDDIDAEYVPDGRPGGRRFVRDYLLPRWQTRRWATCIELANEPTAHPASPRREGS